MLYYVTSLSMLLRSCETSSALSFYHVKVVHPVKQLPPVDKASNCCNYCD